MCNNNREWEDIDFSSCTMRIGSTPIVMLEYNHNIVDVNTSTVTNEVSTGCIVHNIYNNIMDVQTHIDMGKCASMHIHTII